MASERKRSVKARITSLMMKRKVLQKKYKKISQLLATMVTRIYLLTLCCSSTDEDAVMDTNE